MRRTLFFIASCLGLSAVLAHGGETPRPSFPDVAQLPSRPGLPDPLVMLNGDRVTTEEQWVDQRKPELKALFQHYMYGVMPAEPGRMHLWIGGADEHAFGGKATISEIEIGFAPPDTPMIHLLLAVPNRGPRPVPVFLGLNFCGNHTLLQDPSIALPTVWMPDHCPGCKDHRATEAGRGRQVDVWSIETIIDRGYAVATFYCGDVAPDHPGFNEGVFPHYRTKGQNQADDWGAVAAWAWGLMRAMDYMRVNPELDWKRIIVVGHSRLGKAALLAGALDDRIALTIAHQAGCGGSAPSRGTVGESVKQINDHFPHWFNAEFKKFNDCPDRLPFDQHCLIALAAPRPVLLTNAVDDTWANPEGQFQMLRAADPVYRLLGVKGLDEERMPEPGKVVGDRLGYHIRPGKHSMGAEDWEVFLDFADQHFSKKGPK